MQEFTTQAWPRDQRAHTHQYSGDAFKTCHYPTEVLRSSFFKAKGQPYKCTVKYNLAKPHSPKQFKSFLRSPKPKEMYSGHTLNCRLSREGGQSKWIGVPPCQFIWQIHWEHPTVIGALPGQRCWKRNINAIFRALLLPFTKQKCTVSPSLHPSAQYLSTAVPFFKELKCKEKLVASDQGW